MKKEWWNISNAEARRFVRINVLEFLEDESDWVCQQLLARRPAEAQGAIRDAIEAEIEFYRKRAAKNKEGVYGRYRDFLERVYETRIDCKPVAA